MPDFFVYILRSETTGRHYCGQTDDVARRVRQHNDPEYHGSKTTKRFQGPWVVVWSGAGGISLRCHDSRAENQSARNRAFPRRPRQATAQLVESRHAVGVRLTTMLSRS